MENKKVIKDTEKVISWNFFRLRENIIRIEFVGTWAEFRKMYTYELARTQFNSTIMNKDIDNTNNTNELATELEENKIVDVWFRRDSNKIKTAVTKLSVYNSH